MSKEIIDKNPRLKADNDSKEKKEGLNTRVTKLCDQVEELNDRIKKLVFPEGQESSFGGECKTEWQIYQATEQYKHFTENPSHDKTHKYGGVNPSEDVPGTHKCHCHNKGPWPHLMHAGDPVENFQSDVLLTNYDLLKEILKKLEEGGSKDYTPWLKKIVRLIGDQSDVDECESGKVESNRKKTIKRTMFSSDAQTKTEEEIELSDAEEGSGTEEEGQSSEE